MEETGSKQPHQLDPAAAATTHHASTSTVDWRGRSSDPRKHGGMPAAAFLLGLQGFEIMAIAAVGNNLITYVINEMHFPLSKAANVVTNFIGTVFLLALLGGYLSDSFLGSFWTMLIFGFVELSGFILLSVQAHLPQLKPPKCDVMTTQQQQRQQYCPEAEGFKALIFYVALYLVALGSGCVKPNMIAHGADQFNLLQEDHRPNNNNNNNNQSKRRQQQRRRQLSTYFNLAYLAFSMGELIALTVLVYVQTHSGMDVGFGVSAAAMALGLICLVVGSFLYRNKPPQGSIFTPIAQVFWAAIVKRKLASPSHLSSAVSSTGTNFIHAGKFRFLDKACITIKSQQDGGTKLQINGRPGWSTTTVCTVSQVEQVKVILAVVPIFACTIIFNTILAQLQTFSVQQGSAMNTQLTKSFHIPPASLQAIPYIMLIFAVPLYDIFVVPFARKFTGHESGIAPLHRIGFGLFLATFSMVAAALMERKRRNNAASSEEIIGRLSIFWITPQFLIFGLSEMFTAVGLIEFFYKQSWSTINGGMQSFLTAMTYCSYSFGFYLSSLLVSLVNKITRNPSSAGWLGQNDLNKDRLDLFYWLLAALSLTNFFNYLFWSKWYYSHNPLSSVNDYNEEGAANRKEYYCSKQGDAVDDNDIP